MKLLEIKINPRDHSDEVKEALSKRIDFILEAVGLNLEGAAKLQLENEPRRVDTGLLRNSITHVVSGQSPPVGMYRAEFGENKITKGKNKGKRRRASDKNAGSVNVGFYSGVAPNDDEDKKAVYIGTNVKYALYVHEGTKKMKANKFLTNAVDKQKQKITQYIKKEMKK